MSLLNDPTSIHYLVARAGSLPEWRVINNRVNDWLDKRCERATAEGKEAEKALNLDPEVAMYNSIGIMAHEIFEMRVLAEKLVHPRTR